MSLQVVAHTSGAAPTRLPAGLGPLRTKAPWRAYAVSIAFLDALSMAGGAVVAEAVSFGDFGRASTGAGGVPDLVLGAAFVLAWLGVIALGGAYEPRHLGSGSEEYRRVLSCAARLLSIVAIVALISRLEVSRGFVAVTILVGTVLTLAQRYLVRRWLHGQRARGRFMRRVLLVGAEDSARAMALRIKYLPYTGLSVAAACVADRSDGAIEVDGMQVPILGGTSDLLRIVRSSTIDAVLVTDQLTLDVDTLRDLAWQVEGTGVTMLVAPEITDVAGPLMAIRPVVGLPVLTVEQPELGGPRRLMKGAFDRVFGAACLIALLPVLLLIGLAVRLSSPGPVIFKQVRIGLRGRQFVLWKFRTMVSDAESHRPGLLDRNEHDGVLFKMRDDPRVTPLGRLLRRWSVDELLQFWNVVRGDMSIIGPRPPLPDEVENYCDRARRRLLVKPGITGLWQISGRAGLSWDEAVRLDLHYVENWSPSLDLTILAKTVSAVVRGHGAY